MCKITVRLLQGRNLQAGDFGGKSDPYCILRLKSGGPTLRSRTKRNTLNPVWNDEFSFDTLDPNTDILEVHCYDKDFITKDDPLGHVEIPLATVPRYPANQEKQCWYPLSGVKSGQVELCLKCDEQDVSAKPFQIHTSSIAGGLTAGRGESILDGFVTYEVALFHVKQFFGNTKQNWNVNYDKAVKIFGTEPMSVLVRKTIAAQHAELYRKGIWKTKQGNIKTGDELLRLMNFGIKAGCRRMFTYVILDDKWNFSETDSTFFKDFMSKHATHSNVARQVVYAGEFFIRRDPIQGIFSLVIDNNSGTYSPDLNLLPMLARLLETNFPGLKVEALDFKNPLLASYKKELEEERARKPQSTQQQQQQPQQQPIVPTLQYPYSATASGNLYPVLDPLPTPTAPFLPIDSPVFDDGLRPTPLCTNMFMAQSYVDNINPVPSLDPIHNGIASCHSPIRTDRPSPTPGYYNPTVSNTASQLADSLKPPQPIYPVQNTSPVMPSYIYPNQNDPTNSFGASSFADTLSSIPAQQGSTLPPGVSSSVRPSDNPHVRMEFCDSSLPPSQSFVPNYSPAVNTQNINNSPWM